MHKSWHQKRLRGPIEGKLTMADEPCPKLADEWHHGNAQSLSVLWLEALEDAWRIVRDRTSPFAETLRAMSVGERRSRYPSVTNGMHPAAIAVSLR